VTHFDAGTGDEWPRDGDLGADPFVFWDAAYVLGSLSSTDRREYEEHLSDCPSCRDAVSDLSGVPALLALLDGDDVAELADDQPELPPLRPELLESLLAKVTRRRRHWRQLAGTALAAAAVVLAIGLVVTFWPGQATQTHQPPQASASALTMMPVVPNSIEATVTLTSHRWGTSVEMSCTYHDKPGEAGDADVDGGDKMAMVAVGRDGSRTQLATWLAVSGVTAQPAGSTAMQINDIAEVQVVSSDTGAILLQRTL
jgi:hypothetical protein